MKCDYCRCEMEEKKLAGINFLQRINAVEKK
jgi:hypothetical protein